MFSRVCWHYSCSTALSAFNYFHSNIYIYIHLGIVAETGKFVAVETPWVRFSCLLDFVPCFLLSFFFFFFSDFWPASRYIYRLRVLSSVQQPSATLSKYVFYSTCSFCLCHLYPTPSRNYFVFNWILAKVRYTWSLWCQNKVHIKTKYKHTPGALRLANVTSYLFLAWKGQVQLILSTLSIFQLILASFNQWSYISAPTRIIQRLIVIGWNTATYTYTPEYLVYNTRSLLILHV